MGCKVTNTKCCFDCDITHCPYMCYGMGKNNLYKECEYYVDADNECIYQKLDED